MVKEHLVLDVSCWWRRGSTWEQNAARLHCSKIDLRPEKPILKAHSTQHRPPLHAHTHGPCLHVWLSKVRSAAEAGYRYLWQKAWRRSAFAHVAPSPTSAPSAHHTQLRASAPCVERYAHVPLAKEREQSTCPAFGPATQLNGGRSGRPRGLT
jgi:hypothetical protein